MPKMGHRHLKIYKSWRHVVVTILFLVVPFLFLLFFAKISHVATSNLLLDTSISLWRMLIAYLIAALLGWLFAVLLYKGKRATIALPFFDVLQSFPTYAGLPLAVLYWGKSNFTVIFFLVLAVIWPIFFSIISSLKLIRRDWEEAVEVSGLKGPQYLWNFLIPISVPGLITGSIIGLGDGWEALIATEIIVGIGGGLGGFFQFFSNNPRVTVLGILAFLLVIFTINKLIWLPLLEWSHRHIGE